MLFQTNSVLAQKKRPMPKPRVLTAREIAAKVLPSVVLIMTQDENGNSIAQGSGFVYKPGLVVSNLHVFERASKAIVKDVKTGEMSKAVAVVGMNAKDDICVIRVDNLKYPSLPIGDSDSVQTGDEIYVASNPKGLEGSFTKGVISGLRTDLGLFQFDAAISAGSSGGVLLNTKAEAVGIIKSSLVSGQNLNFAIPVNMLKQLPLDFNHPIRLAGACALSDRGKNGLKGLVKEVFEYSPYADDWWNRTMYDLDGTETRITSYMASLKTTLVFIRRYNDNRLLVESSYWSNDRLKDEKKWSREEAIEKRLNDWIGGRIESNVDGSRFVFNSYGELVLEDNPKAGVKFVTEFDGFGRKMRQTAFYRGELDSETRFSYKDDKHGNWIEKYEAKWTRRYSLPRGDEPFDLIVKRSITYF